MVRPFPRALAALLLAPLTACGASFGRYPDGPPPRPEPTGRVVALEDVVLTSNGSAVSRAAGWVRAGNAPCGWSSRGLRRSRVVTETRPAEAEPGSVGTEASVAYVERLDLACPDFQAAPALLAPAGPPDVGRSVGPVRSATKYPSGATYEGLVCGWTSATPTPEGGFLGRPVPACREGDALALVAEALAELRAEAARLGAHRVHDVQCYGHSADQVLRFWCEGDARERPSR